MSLSWCRLKKKSKFTEISDGMCKFQYSHLLGGGGGGGDLGLNKVAIITVYDLRT